MSWLGRVADMFGRKHCNRSARRLELAEQKVEAASRRFEKAAARALIRASGDPAEDYSAAQIHDAIQAAQQAAELVAGKR